MIVKQFSVTKRFVSGVLKGMTLTLDSGVPFTVGKRYKACVGSSDYVVIACKRL
jgi:hypothetical protein